MGFLGFIGDALNDILGGNSSRRDQQRYNLQNMEIQQGYTRENMELQNQYNIEAFQRENEYNSPLAQQERLRRAGLNVNWSDAGSAIAQQDSGVSTSAPSGAMPSGQNAGGLGDLISLGSAIKDLKVKQSQIDLNEALEKKAESDSFKADEEGKGQSFQNWLSENYGVADKEAGISLTSNSAALTQRQVENYFGESVARISKLLAERENLDISTKQLKQILPYLVPEILSRVNLNNAAAYYQNMQGQYVPTFANAASMQGRAALGQVEVARERNRIEWTVAESLENLQTSQSQKIDAETIAQRIQNGVSAYAYKEGISKKIIKRQSIKLGTEILNQYTDYRIKHPRATWSEFYNAMDVEKTVVDGIYNLLPIKHVDIPFLK